MERCSSPGGTDYVSPSPRESRPVPRGGCDGRLHDQAPGGGRRRARRLPRRDADDDDGARGRAGRVHVPAHAAAHGREGVVRPPAQDAGGGLLRHVGEAPVQARRRRARPRSKARWSGCRRRPGVPSGTTSPRTPSSSSCRRSSRADPPRTPSISRTSGLHSARDPEASASRPLPSVPAHYPRGQDSTSATGLRHCSWNAGPRGPAPARIGSLPGKCT